MSTDLNEAVIRHDLVELFVEVINKYKEEHSWRIDSHLLFDAFCCITFTPFADNSMKSKIDILDDSIKLMTECLGLELGHFSMDKLEDEDFS